MARAGIFNFWYYDDQEFHLSEGRLILRGTNGSGKSVTMQSFLPLVLDGDKRPWRLDPFGSRDRRIEYYLLGDIDSGINERTGYLYLEFFHPEQEKRITVGMGLRARRGAKAITFWGFSILDQRQIGKDFFLYDVDQYEKHGVKIPLQQDKFAEQLGPGGKLVREQAEYRRMVNKVLFGFEDEESYQELLDLLIQLRSPKLSKDFKPTTIYDILTDALPSLQEEELRPLSDVLEDMDQISDSLDELSIHRKEVERLDEAYTRYNQFLLFQTSAQLMEAKKERDTRRGEVNSINQEWDDLQKEQDQLKEQIQHQQEDLQRAQTEEEILSKHEALEKQRELNEAKGQKEDVQKQMESAQRRLDAAKERYQSSFSQKEQGEEELQNYQQQQEEKWNELEEIARDAEFRGHDVYHRQWQNASPFLESAWKSWKKDLNEHTLHLQEAHELAQKEREWKNQVQQAETEMSEAREERDQQERGLRQKEKQMEEALRQQEDDLLQWFRTLNKLPLSEENWRNILHTLVSYPEQTYAQIKQPAVEVYDSTRDEWHKNVLQREHQIANYQEEKEKIRIEWQEWKQKKEPEPPRRDARAESRLNRQQEGELGAPLYALCEFQEHLTVEEKARTESLLEYTGLLDAWISEKEQILMENNQEEFFIQASPAEFAHTLADLLVPTPPAEGWISSERIHAILRTIRLDEGTGEGQTWMNEQGQFQLGALYGQIVPKPVAEYIGKKTREQTRLARMQELELQMAVLEEKIEEEQQRKQQMEADLSVLRAELDSFPKEDPLAQTEQEHKDASYLLAKAQQYLQKKAEQHQQKVKEWRVIQQQLGVKTDSWSRLKNESTLRQALEDIRYYQNTLSELGSTYKIAAKITEQVERLHAEMENSTEQIEIEEEELFDLEGKKRVLQQRIDTFTTLLEELGILDLHQKLEVLQSNIKSLKEQVYQLKESIQKLEIEQAKMGERLRIQQEQLEEQEVLLTKKITLWLSEWKRSLLAEWKEEREKNPQLLTNEDAIVQEELCARIAQIVVRKFSKTYEQKTREQVTNQCLDIFAEIKNILLDYVLERHFEEESGRLIILSMRDRNNPLSPSVLREELVQLEEEQRLLLNQKDRELYEQIIIHSVGKAIRHKIYRAESWVKQMNRLMDERKTSSGLKLSLEWEPRTARNDRELDTFQLVTLLKKDPELLREEEMDSMVTHFRSRIHLAKQEAEQQDTLRKWITELLDYRGWFDFTLYYKKGDGPRRQLTDSRFNVLSGGEKAMAMYIPLFAATYSRYSDSRPDSPKIISLDEAFAGVDEENMRDMFKLLTDMDFDYMMTSQVLWGCYDTVPHLSIYEILRPNDVDFVTLIRYYWNGYMRELVDDAS